MIGGRRGWLAWPAGLACAGVVAGLVWLALPGVPTAVRFAGDVLRAGMATGAPQAEAPAPGVGPVTDECRSLYPDALWVQLSWQRHVILDQTRTPSATTATAVRDALAPKVMVTCTWRNGVGGSIATTLATVDAESQPVAREGLTGQGFGCTDWAGGIRCTKASGDTTEVSIIRGGSWLSTTETAWHPAGYVDALAARVWR